VSDTPEIAAQPVTTTLAPGSMSGALNPTSWRYSIQLAARDNELAADRELISRINHEPKSMTRSQHLEHTFRTR
jgi:hypothetical protein